jgi:hypothetical protein
VTAYRRSAYRYRSPYRRSSGAGRAAGVALGLLLAWTAAKSAHSTGRHPAQPVHHAQLADVAGSGENAFWAAVLADLGARPTQADENSLTAWAAHEGPWGSVGINNPLDSTLPMAGAWPFNTFDGNLHVWNYPDASTGAQATALTIEGYPGITAALRTGNGVCGGGLAYEFGRWSGGGYTEVC